jgi:hypothetical protein
MWGVRERQGMGEMEGQMGWDRKFENNDELKGREEGREWERG